ncbi:MAG TPA: TlpA disulfide reductase family protein [Gammaproteobacteria bacterium]
MKSRYIAYLLLFLAGLWGGNELVKVFFSNEEISTTAQTELHRPAFPFALQDLDGNTHEFGEWNGKVRVLNFWATWCPPCRKETPLFVEMQEQLGSQGLQFIGIAIDEKHKVQDFMDTYGVNYPILIGTDDAIEVAKQYGNRFGALPWTVVINREGTIVHVQGGEMTRQKAESIVQPLL